MKKILSCPIFWYSTTEERGDGNWYHVWHNWLVSILVKPQIEGIEVFAGYNRRALRKKSGTLQDAISRFME